MHEINDLVELIKSRVAIVVIESREEQRALELLQKVSSRLNLALYGWSITRGFGCVGENKSFNKGQHGPDEFLQYLWNMKMSGIYVLLDFHPYLTDPKNVRLIKDIAQQAERCRITLIFLSHQVDLPAELFHFSARFELRLPSEDELMEIVAEVAKKWSREHDGRKIQGDKEAARLLVKNLTGLSASEVQRLVRRALRDNSITHEDLSEVAKAKYELLNKDGVLYFEHDVAALSEVGGFRRLKQWLEQRREVFLGLHTRQGVDRPKGILLLGVQGSGKSLAAKAVAGSWGVPLLRLDFGALYDKYYGETERKLRDSLKTAEVMAPCVMWLDEIEKGVATGDNDGGTSRRVLGTLLTWMAERHAAVFIVATANDIQSLPPELMRKGRVDEIFFVDLPDDETRKEIFAIHLKKRELDPAAFDLQALAKASAGFSGAEIEQAVVAGLYSMINGSGILTHAALLNEINATRPLSVIMAEHITGMRLWAMERTVPAN